MDDLERQIRTWADAAAPEGAGVPVTTDEVRATVRHDEEPGRSDGVDANELDPSPVGGRRRRWLAAAAAVAAVAALGVGALALTGGDDAEPLDVGTTTTTTTVDPLAGPVGFEVLAVAQGGRAQPWGPGTIARTPGEVAQLWADAGLDAPTPTVDLEERVVVGMTIIDGACPPILEGFAREGDGEADPTIRPVLDTTAADCVEPMLGHTLVVAVDWATVGDAFTLHIPAQGRADLIEVRAEVRRLAAEPEVEVTWELDETTVAAGDPLSGEVTVVNRSGAPIEGTTCGPFFAVRLRGPEAEQVVARPLCASGFTIPEGRSTYELRGTTSHSSCTLAPAPDEDDLACAPDGTVPSLPPGTYEALLDQATPGLVPPPDPIMVTIT